MSDYINIGNNARSLNTAPYLSAYTGVMLWYDDEHAYSAGDVSGRVLTATCPWATQQMADDMKKKGGFIPGIKPGKATVDKLDEIMSRITLPGAIFLAIIGILPVFAILCGVNNQFAQFYGGTSLLILVGVILDTLQQIESHLLMRHYDGLMKSGRIKGRAGSGM